MAEFSWLTALGFVFLTFNSGMAVYRSNGDTGSILFVAVSYVDLVALFACLRIYEGLDRHSPRREKVKAAVWSLTTLLTVMFSYKVAEIMPLPVKIVVWAMAAATTCGGFYAFFIHNEKQPQAAPAAAKPPPNATMAPPKSRLGTCYRQVRASVLTVASYVRSHGQLDCSSTAWISAVSLPFSAIFAVTSIVSACQCAQIIRSVIRYRQIRCCNRRERKSFKFAALLVRGKIVLEMQIGFSGLQFGHVLATRKNSMHPVEISFVDFVCAQALLARESLRTRADWEKVNSAKEDDEERRKTEEWRNRRRRATNEWKKRRFQDMI